MNFIIKIGEDKYFAGWDAVLGCIKVVTDESLAYRMRRPIASRTLPKILSEYDCATIESVA